MADDNAPRPFDDQARRTLYEQRIVVLDGPLTDDKRHAGERVLAASLHDR